VLKSINETNDHEYREFIIDYVLRYYGKVLLTKEESFLLKPTHHFGPKFQPDTIQISNGFTDKDGCCGEALHYETSELPRPCIRTDAKIIEDQYQLHEIDMPGLGSLDHWRCLGWVNFNFKSSRMANAFRIRCVERILTEHTEIIFSNNCPSCGRLKRTPKAKKCMWCSH